MMALHHIVGLGLGSEAAMCKVTNMADDVPWTEWWSRILAVTAGAIHTRAVAKGLDVRAWARKLTWLGMRGVAGKDEILNQNKRAGPGSWSIEERQHWQSWRSQEAPGQGRQGLAWLIHSGLRSSMSGWSLHKAWSERRKPPGNCRPAPLSLRGSDVPSSSRRSRFDLLGASPVREAWDQIPLPDRAWFVTSNHWLPHRACFGWVWSPFFDQKNTNFFFGASTTTTPLVSGLCILCDLDSSVHFFTFCQLAIFPINAVSEYARYAHQQNASEPPRPCYSGNDRKTTASSLFTLVQPQVTTSATITAFPALGSSMGDTVTF